MTSTGPHKITSILDKVDQTGGMAITGKYQSLIPTGNMMELGRTRATW